MLCPANSNLPRNGDLTRKPVSVQAGITWGIVTSVAKCGLGGKQ